MKNRGFSLLEVCTVVIIAGILASVAVYNYNTYTDNAKKKEANSVLNAIYSAEKAYRLEQGQYTTSLSSLSIANLASGSTYYTYKITSTDPSSSYTATATPRKTGASCFNMDNSGNITETTCGGGIVGVPSHY